MVKNFMVIAHNVNSVHQAADVGPGCTDVPDPQARLKRASASRSSGQWKDDGCDVIADGKVVGRIFNAAASTAKWD